MVCIVCWLCCCWLLVLYLWISNTSWGTYIPYIQFLFASSFPLAFDSYRVFVSYGCLRFLDVLLLMFSSLAFLMSVSSCLLWMRPEAELDFLHILSFWVKFTSDYWLPMCKVIRYHSRPLCRVKVVCFEDNIFSFIGPSFSAYKVVCVLLICRRFSFASTFFHISHVVAVALSNRDFPPEGVGSGGWTTAASA